MNKYKPIKDSTLVLGGEVGKLVNNIIDKWLIDIRETNPAILDIFKDQNLKPYRHLLAWSGEFAGKYLTGATMIYRLNHNKALGEALQKFVEELISLQKKNGYIGPFQDDRQLSGTEEPKYFAFDPNSKPEQYDTWDSWGHYHIMTGLLLWYDTTDYKPAYDAVLKIAELFINSFYGPGQKRIVDTKSEEMNLSVVHTFANLYRRTSEKKYLTFAEHVVDDLAVPPAGDYLRQGLSGIDFYKMPKPRWESLHPIQGLLEMYQATGNDDYRKAVENIWWSITATDVHNTGGFSTWEMAMGNPYQDGPIETCCVIAYMALTVDMLSLTGDSTMADMLEMATYNSSLGSFNPSGKWSTYDTPMYGYKRANYNQIGFQCRPGSPDLNCCSVNAPRAFGFLSDWAYMQEENAIVINYYGENSICCNLGERKIKLHQETIYPFENTVKILIDETDGKEFTLKIRAPFWSDNTTLCVNGGSRISINKGYYTLTRCFKSGDEITVRFDMELKVWAGEDRLSGMGSLFYGPLVLCADGFYDNQFDVEHLEEINTKSLFIEAIEMDRFAGGIFHLNDGEKSFALCDLYTAGSSGTCYTTWLPMSGYSPVKFSKENPFRLQRIK